MERFSLASKGGSPLFKKNFMGVKPMKVRSAFILKKGRPIPRTGFFLGMALIIFVSCQVGADKDSSVPFASELFIQRTSQKIDWGYPERLLPLAGPPLSLPLTDLKERPRGEIHLQGFYNASQIVFLLRIPSSITQIAFSWPIPLQESAVGPTLPPTPVQEPRSCATTCHNSGALPGNPLPKGGHRSSGKGGFDVWIFRLPQKQWWDGYLGNTGFKSQVEVDIFGRRPMKRFALFTVRRQTFLLWARDLETTSAFDLHFWDLGRPYFFEVAAWNSAGDHLKGQGWLRFQTPLLPQPAFPTSDPSAIVQRGKQWYEGHCQVCHGVRGRSSTPAPHLVGVRNRMSDQELLTRIRLGTGRMPGFNLLMSDQQIRELIEYLKTL